jgi:hypothetical protein
MGLEAGSRLDGGLGGEDEARLEGGFGGWRQAVGG